MDHLWLQVLLVTHSFFLSIGKPTNGYRFEVYPVEQCPMNATEFDIAARRRNCTDNLRYLCAPNIYLTSLIEFCTDRRVSLFEKGNCIRLEGTGDLNHYKCTDTFSSGCPTVPYTDETIYENPACLAINTAFKCFVAEKECPKSENRTLADMTKSNGNLTGLIYFIVYAIIIVVIGAATIVFHKTAKDKKMEDEKKRKFFTKAVMTVCHVRGIIVGCKEAGKTTLLKRLQNISYREIRNIKSTEIVDIHANSFHVIEEEETIQKVDEKKNQRHVIIPTRMSEGNSETHQAIYNLEELEEDQGYSKDFAEFLIVRESNQINPENIHINKSMTEDLESAELNDNEENTSLMYKDETPTDSKEPGSQINSVGNTGESKKDDSNIAVHDIMNAVKKLSNETQMRPQITFIDFAGQKMYYAFHQIYLSPRTFCILVVDMTKDFDDIVEEPEINEMIEKGCSRFESWTYRDYYKFWVESIDSFADENTPIILVGTRGDKLSKQVCHRFFDNFFDIFDDHPNLRRHLHRDRKFAIGFPETGSKLKKLTGIKHCIAKIVKRPYYSEQNIRPVWAIFELILQKKRESKHFILRSDLQIYNRQLRTEIRLDDGEITKMLSFLHRVGTLLYFEDDGLEEVIILDIQWFLDAFKCIIEYPVNEHQSNDTKRDSFYHTGELDDEELDEILKLCQKNGKHYVMHKQVLISFMEQLGLLAVCNEGKSVWYYIPCMNKRVFQKTDEKFTKSSILCFTFDKHKQLPYYIFCVVVLRCFKIREWSILTEKSTKQKCIYEKIACFKFRNHIVVLCFCKFQIQVQVWKPAEGAIDTVLLKEVQQSVENILRKYSRYLFKIGYKCTNGVLNSENDQTFIEQKVFPVSDFLCETCNPCDKHYVGNDVCWVKTDTDNDQDSMQGIEVKQKDSMKAIEVKQEESMKGSEVKKEESMNGVDINIEDSMKAIEVKQEESINGVDIKIEGNADMCLYHQEESMTEMQVRQEDSMKVIEVKQEEPVKGSEVKKEESMHGVDIKIEESMTEMQVRQEDFMKAIEVKQEESMKGPEVKKEESMNGVDIKIEGNADMCLYHQEESTMESEVKEKEPLTDVYMDAFFLNSEIMDRIGVKDMQSNYLMERPIHDIISTSPLERFKPLQEDLKKRLSTFNNYPKTAAKNKEDLAENGFHYIGAGQDDKVQCVFCGVTLHEWTKEDDIMSEHRRFSRDCMHIYQLDHKNFGPMMYGGLSQADLISFSPMNDIGRLPHMKELTIRLNSFRDWKYTEDEKPSPEAIANAGLFYTGKNDTTQCWCCGNLLEEWEPGDEPKQEHDIHFPDCKLAAH